MANAKKPTASKAKTTSTAAKKTTAARKPTTTKAATTRKVTTTTKAPVKKTASKSAPKKSTPTSTKSDFMTLQPTRETAYWLIFSLLILALGIWVLTLTIRINNIYDQIERNNNAVSTLDSQAAAMKAAKDKAAQ